MSLLLKNLLRQPSKTSYRFLKFWKNEKLDVCNLVEPGNISPERDVPEHIVKPDYYYQLTEPGNTLGTPEIKSLEQILRMRESCRLAATILKSCESVVQIGITTDEIDAYVHDKIIKAGGYPSPLRYAGFPKSICTSVNNVACHGIPDDRKLLDGDIINIDITVFLNGYHGDCSKTFLIGNVDEKGKYLVNCTEECMNLAIERLAPERPFNEIGRFIEEYAKSKGLNVIPAFIGHGIGSYFHGPPEILNFTNSLPGTMKAGITFTVEPILTIGKSEIELHEDGWTSTTVDNARTAQFEHTVLITDNGVEILTLPE